MSFAFGFTDEDLVDENGFSDLTRKPAIPQTNDASPLDNLTDDYDASVAPQWHSIESILESLENIRMSFEEVDTPKNKITVYRRELFDVKHQLMSENEPEEGVDSDAKYVFEENDLHKNVYEGGFKSWECSYDIIDKQYDLIDCSNYLEMGCGTALPSAYLLSDMFKRDAAEFDNPKKIILSDFNYLVLKLVTVPNIVFNWYITRHKGEPFWGSSIPSNEIIMSRQLIDKFLEDLKLYKLTIDLISGSWGLKFAHMIQDLNIDLVITSETIYSPETFPVLSEVLIHLKRLNRMCQIIVAGKSIYFGVGGSIADFVSYWNRRTGKYPLVEEISDGGLKRLLVYIQ
ncbi:uncharacterized protein KQ657_001861 [Scheffersomyces spartinae]|uniref:protein-histidine N-methyltransferase n=1 Tax=Scheffersomyces spartinae TaxID=45513 RepID=A0A9P8AGK4_9ASCO|nr:uncharacterized protein KQ657_001861 [Scheffersomyces spartinae]KAG7192460.1 hypothetical protein KQ657_001861 [Scheffersomyces spartinae]